MLPAIILVEDNAMVARTLMRALRRLCTVRHASSVADALPIISEGGFSALLCDWRLEDGTGEGALALCAEQFPAARRVLLTGARSQEIDAILERNLAHQILEKTCDMATLTRAIGLDVVDYPV